MRLYCRIALIALVASFLLVDSHLAAPTDFDNSLRVRYASRFNHLDSYLDSNFNDLIAYAQHLDCSKIACLRKDSVIMDAVADIVSITAARGEAKALAEGRINCAQDLVQARIDELQKEFYNLWKDLAGIKNFIWSDPRVETVSQLIQDEMNLVIKILKSPATLDASQKDYCAKRYLQSDTDTSMTINDLIDYVTAMKCKDDNLMLCLEKDPNVMDKLGDVVYQTVEQGEMRALADGRVKSASDLVQARREELEASLKRAEKTFDDENARVGALSRVLHEELELAIKIISNLE